MLMQNILNSISMDEMCFLHDKIEKPFIKTNSIYYLAQFSVKLQSIRNFSGNCEK